jgi:hypothetical protein
MVVVLDLPKVSLFMEEMKLLGLRIQLVQQLPEDLILVLLVIPIVTLMLLGFLSVVVVTV